MGTCFAEWPRSRPWFRSSSPGCKAPALMMMQYGAHHTQKQVSSLSKLCSERLHTHRFFSQIAPRPQHTPVTVRSVVCPFKKILGRSILSRRSQIYEEIFAAFLLLDRAFAFPLALPAALALPAGFDPGEARPATAGAALRFLGAWRMEDLASIFTVELQHIWNPGLSKKLGANDGIVQSHIQLRDLHCFGPHLVLIQPYTVPAKKELGKLAIQSLRTALNIMG